MSSIRLLTIALIPCLASWAPAQKQPPAPEDTPPLHWAVQLGLRSLQVEMSFPLIDQVVLVPDAGTYMDELAQWSSDGRWPVLFEDDRFAPMFIRRFQPRRVLVRESVGDLPAEPRAREAQLQQLIVRIWGGDPETETVVEALAASAYPPPGVVLASVNDPAWTAAVALAAGRGQPLLWFDDDLGRPGAALDVQQTDRLRADVEALLRSLDAPFEDMGDVLDTITMCRSMPGRVTLDLPSTLRAPAPEQYRDGPLALTDALGRHADGRRYAFAGWIFGDEVRCAYVAMCSLFIDRRSFQLINTYPEENAWSVYSMRTAREQLVGYGYESELSDGAQAALAPWRRLLSGGLSSDVLLMNSRGNARHFFLSDVRTSVLDLPVHHAPVAVHFTHSWSMQAPDQADTIAARWLDGGAYAYVGSMHEPMLTAFVPPAALIERFNGLVPFLVAARRWNGEGVYSLPWRVNTFGDPLMLCPAPDRVERTRRAPTAERGIDLGDRVRAQMESLRTEPTPESYAAAIRTLILLGRDELAAQVWTLARRDDAAGPAAGLMLECFFRLGQPDAFGRAWAEVEDLDERRRDLFWHLRGEALEGRPDARQVLEFERAIRSTRPDEDLRRLAPHVDRVFGRQRVRELIRRAHEQTPDGRVGREIKKMLETYPEQ